MRCLRLRGGRLLLPEPAAGLDEFEIDSKTTALENAAHGAPSSRINSSAPDHILYASDFLLHAKAVPGKAVVVNDPLDLLRESPFMG